MRIMNTTRKISNQLSIIHYAYLLIIIGQCAGKIIYRYTHGYSAIPNK